MDGVEEVRGKQASQDVPLSVGLLRVLRRPGVKLPNLAVVVGCCVEKIDGCSSAQDITVHPVCPPRQRQDFSLGTSCRSSRGRGPGTYAGMHPLSLLQPHGVILSGSITGLVQWLGFRGLMVSSAPGMQIQSVNMLACFDCIARFSGINFCKRVKRFITVNLQRIMLRQLIEYPNPMRISSF